VSVNSNRMPRVRAVVSTRRTCADMAQLRRGGAVVGEGGSLEGYAPSWAREGVWRATRRRGRGRESGGVRAVVGEGGSLEGYAPSWAREGVWRATRRRGRGRESGGLRAVVGEGGSLEGCAPSWAPDARTSKAGIATGHAGIETEWPAASRDAMRPGE